MKPFAALLVAAALVGGAAHAQGLAQNDGPVAAASPAGAAQFLAANAKAPGVVSLPDGLQYKVLASGPAGPSPKEGDIIKVQYEGTLTSGKMFDNNNGKAALMPFQGLIPAWMEALTKMHVGDEWMLYVPPELGYGPEGAGNVIPPNSVLIFKVKLAGMLSAD
jgi:peptidylprolyl isomerase/FKBP-type peptidyl-prolyl cis-trans isomerase FklB